MGGQRGARRGDQAVNAALKITGIAARNLMHKRGAALQNSIQHRQRSWGCQRGHFKTSATDLRPTAGPLSSQRGALEPV